MAIEITASNFEAEIVKHSGVALVDFWATWCGPCKMLSPVIDELSKDYNGKVKIGKVNIDEHGPLAAKFGIQSIPTVLIFKNGKVLSQVIGVVSKSEPAKRIDLALQS